MIETNSPFFPNGEDPSAHRKYFSHVSEPAFSVWHNKCSVNAACLKKLPDCTHIQILVHSAEKKLIIRPCKEDEKDSLRWHRRTCRTPRQISCPLFAARLFLLMEWHPQFRYRIIGKCLQSDSASLLVFDLTAPEILCRPSVSISAGLSDLACPKEPIKRSETSAAEPIPIMQIKAVDDRIIFGIRNDKKKKENPQ